MQKGNFADDSCLEGLLERFFFEDGVGDGAMIDNIQCCMWVEPRTCRIMGAWSGEVLAS